AEVTELAKQEAVVIVPIGSTEQHGVALPVSVDARTVTYVSRRGAQLAEVPALVTPLIPFGVSPHHMMYGGTISLRVETVIAVLTDICESVVADGFDRIIILNGHGGNSNTIGAAALQLKHQLGRQIQAITWWDLIPGVIESVREGPCTTIGHAGESEASCILALTPDAVRKDKLILVEGISDDPKLGTAAKGETILNAAAEALARKLKEVAASPGKQVVGIERVRA
ncbi:MAG: creatininase family protein, partial [Chloroflexi bacterium]|nr:creatininase family protein [Chloroflexota bacterium]